jgi:tetratricopeptide (TPR) repeat protein
LGVAFGYLVAMDSPSGRGEGEFHWGTTLWHEMAHVFTLEATNHLVPRWFSEGVSVFEEWSTGPRPGRHIPMHVLDAMKEEKFLSILDIDRGFIRPEYQGQLMVSYMQAGLICQYIERDWGQQGLVDLLQLYRDGADTGEAIEEGLGVTPSQFDLGFNSFIESAFRPTLDVLDDWKEQTQLAHEAANEGDWNRVLALSSASIQLYPGYVEEGDVYILNAKAHEELGQAGAAIDRLEEYWRLGGYEPRVLHQLADWLYQSNRPDDAIAVLNDVIFSAPLDESLHTKLGDWLLESEKGELALREYSSLLAMKPHDEAAAHYRLATAYRQLENEEKTREHLLYALETAPHYREAQQLLLEILR